MKTRILGIFALLLSSLAGATPVSYEMEIVRVKGNLECAVALDHAQDFTCKVLLSGQNSIKVEMVREADGSGFEGVDRVVKDGFAHSLVFNADDKLQLRQISLLTDSTTADGQTLNADLASSSSQSLDAIKVMPIQVKFTSSDSVNVTAEFFYYADARSSRAAQTLRPMLLKKIAPLFKILKTYSQQS